MFRSRNASRSLRSSLRKKAKTGFTISFPNISSGPNLQALPSSQRTLMTLVLRKLLASSTFAIAGALNSISDRLKKKLRKQEPPPEALAEELDQDYEALDETAEEWTDDEPHRNHFRGRSCRA